VRTALNDVRQQGTGPAFVVKTGKSVEPRNKLWSNEIKGKSAVWFNGAERIGMQ